MDFCGFRFLWVLIFNGFNGVVREIIANFMYQQILWGIKGINLPYREKLMPNTAYLVLLKAAKSGRCKSSDPL